MPEQEREERPMASEQEARREWHRLFGLLLKDLFTDSPFKVDPECDLSVQQQFLDVAILRQRRGQFKGRLPDGMDGLTDHNLFSASRELVEFGRGAYRQRSERTSGLLAQLLVQYQGEGLGMSFTMEDFLVGFFQEHFPELTPEQQEKLFRALPPESQALLVRALPPESQALLVQSLPPEKRLEGMSAEQIRRYLDQLSAPAATEARKPRRKK